MNDNFDDQLSRQLASLGSDLGEARLPGPAAARQRAAQRTRNQITGGVVAGIAVVAVGAIGIIQPDFRADTPQPVDTPTANPTTDTVAVPDDALMTVEDVTGDTGVDWQTVDDPGESYACVPTAPEGATQLHLVTDSQNAKFDQFVEAPANPAERFAQLRSEIEACVDGLSQQGEMYRLDQAWAVHGLGEEAWTAAYWAPLLEPDEYAGAAIVQVRLVRSGQYVTVVIDGGAAQDFNGPMEVQRAEQAAERLCEAVETICPGTLDFQRLHPPVVGDLPGWLSADQVAQATGLAQIAEGSEPRSSDGWNYIGLPVPPDEARSVDSRDFFDPTNPTDIPVTQTVARFDDEDAARRHFDELVAAADSFTQDGDVIENTGTVNGDGYEGVTWRSENEEFGTVFGYGVVTSGDAVAAVVFTAGNADLTADQMRQLVQLAGEQLAAG